MPGLQFLPFLSNEFKTNGGEGGKNSNPTNHLDQG